MIELTSNQVTAIAQASKPAHLVDPGTGEVFILIKKDVYELTCKIVGGAKGQAWDDSDDDLTAPRADA